MEKYTYPDIYQCATGQKLSFHEFVADWIESHNVTDAYQEEQIIRAMYLCHWAFFTDELIDYFEACTDRYKINADGTVTVFEV